MAMTDRDPLDVEADMESTRAAIVGESPIMEQPPDGSVTLFRGLVHGMSWHTDAEVSELTGEDEEVIARSMAANDSWGFVNAILLQGVKRVGPLVLTDLPTAERVGTIDRLLIGEKELLFLNVLRVTYGDTRTVTTVCPSCQETNEVDFSISEDVPIRILEDPQRPSYTFTLKDGTTLEYRLVTGDDQTEATKRRGATIAEQNTITLSRCIVTHMGMPLVDPMVFARRMSAADRRKLLDEISSKQPGPHFEEVKLPCAACGVMSSFLPSWADLL